MTDDEIFNRVQYLAKEAGYPDAYKDSYVDVACVLAVRPKNPWRPIHTHHCRILVFKNRVQRYERRFPINQTVGDLVGKSFDYDTEAEMLSAMERLDEIPSARCWNP